MQKCCLLNNYWDIFQKMKDFNKILIKFEDKSDVNYRVNYEIKKKIEINLNAHMF